MRVDFNTEEFAMFLREACFIMDYDTMSTDSDEYRDVYELYATCVRYEYSKTSKDVCIRLVGAYQMLTHVSDPVGVMLCRSSEIKRKYVKRIEELRTINTNVQFDLEFLSLIMCLCEVATERASL